VTGHLFLAAGLSVQEQHVLSASLAEADCGDHIPGKRQPPENWHITLSFVGECTESEAERIAFGVAENLNADPTRVWCTGLGSFPKPAKASVVYVGVDDPDNLLAYLAGVCDEAAVDAGFMSEHRPYVPHVTLSRIRPPRDLRQLLSGCGEFRVPIGITEITMYRTRSTKTGPTYDVVERMPLSPVGR